jgi:alpha-amylase/alpha-mannosidase (GH57 family)
VPAGGIGEIFGRRRALAPSATYNPRLTVSGTVLELLQRAGISPASAIDAIVVVLLIGRSATGRQAS